MPSGEIKSFDGKILSVNSIIKDFQIISPDLFWESNDILVFNELISFLKKIDSFKSSKVELEQYSLPDDLIGFILISTKKFITNKNILELGSGTGRFSLPLAKFFAKDILCIDIDAEAMNSLKNYCIEFDLNPNLIISSLEFLEFESSQKHFMFQ